MDDAEALVQPKIRACCRHSWFNASLSLSLCVSLCLSASCNFEDDGEGEALYCKMQMLDTQVSLWVFLDESITHPTLNFILDKSSREIMQAKIRIPLFGKLEYMKFNASLSLFLSLASSSCPLEIHLQQPKSA
jgi:hypothetical protein